MNFSAWNDAIDTIYAAAAAPNLWPNTLQTIAELLDARGALLLYRHDNGRFGVIVSPTLVMMAKEYDEHWQHLDVRADRVFQAIASGSRDVWADHTIFTDEEVARLPIYQQFLLPHGICWGMTVPVSPSPAVHVILTLLRAREKPGYSDALQNQLLALSRHVERSLSLSIRLMDAEAERVGLAAALDRIDCGVLVLGADQRVLLANRMADRLLGSGLAISSGRLRVTDRAANQVFQDRLAAVESGTVPGPEAQEPLIVPNGERGLIVQVLPLPTSIDVPALQTASAIVLVQDPARERPFDPAVVRDAFKLTLGEARLAVLVGAGAAPADAAETLGIALPTARTVLKRVFEKTGVSRQSELAALMGKLFMLRQ
ncbi:helix-turn-helix transcriptional regulator [Methylobacterium durans]|uniref:LuxR family transcriptional regulator n=1 Tax=Methylobacterium durans TaxID=2202825 RepID=A0A2U8W168_9HYPH|nr:LuxR family transcriptional regulator [Methylobacterium durans]AWN39824.1 LuxR family transcriptional regulator [Methylobacterium durans]